MEVTEPGIMAGWYSVSIIILGGDCMQVMVGKLISGVCAVILAHFLYKKTERPE